MNKTSLALAAILIGGAATAQVMPGTTRPGTPGNSTPGATSSAPMGGVSSSTGATSNIPPASAGGDRNQAAATTSATAPQPARGANSFTMGEARRRIQRNGFTNVTGLKKDDGGVWRGKASKGGTSADIWLDYKGNVGQMADASSSMGSMPGATMSTPGTTTPGTTMGGTTMSRTPTPGTNPAGSSATAR